MAESELSKAAHEILRRALQNAGGRSLQECKPLADNLLDLDAAQGLDAISHQMQELFPLYAFHRTTFHIDENESRHVVGDFKLRFAGNLDIDSFGHFAPR
ncbi:hypothetical protein [Bradyrhizobium sp. LMG 9283]|uniref:hypothetical protein n=1 Tax=Bradyrhizobium sp. LMG 9283 TaxID=592064 RepID=UPI00388DADC2